MTLQTMTLGYARMGKRREVEKALEALLSGTSIADTILQTIREIETHHWKTQFQSESTQRIWGDSDCGLNACRWEEVAPSMKQMVAVAQQLQEESHAK